MKFEGFEDKEIHINWGARLLSALKKAVWFSIYLVAVIFLFKPELEGIAVAAMFYIFGSALLNGVLADILYSIAPDSFKEGFEEMEDNIRNMNK